MRTKQSRSSCWAESKIKMGANWKVSSERPHTHACGTRIMLFKIYFSKKLAKKTNSRRKCNQILFMAKEFEEHVSA